MAALDAPVFSYRPTEPPEPPAPPPPPRRRQRNRWLGAAIAVALVAGVIAVAASRSSSKPSLSQAEVNGIVDKKVKQAVTDLNAQPPHSVQVFNQVAPQIVVIEAEGRDDSQALGSGVVINEQGEILTALHVVNGDSSIKVTFANGNESAATVKSSDPDHDIAVLTPSDPPAK